MKCRACKHFTESAEPRFLFDLELGDCDLHKMPMVHMMVDDDEMEGVDAGKVKRVEVPIFYRCEGYDRPNGATAEQKAEDEEIDKSFKNAMAKMNGPRDDMLVVWPETSK